MPKQRKWERRRRASRVSPLGSGDRRFSFAARLYCYYDFTDSRPRKWSSRLAGQGRKAVLMGICEQEGKSDMGFVIEAMQFTFTALGYEVIHVQRVYRVFDRGLVRKQPDVLEQARRFGASLAESIK